MADTIFLADGARLIPTEHARGPWDPRALHGGAPAALIASAFERAQPGAELRMARLGFQFLRPIPMAPLTLDTQIVRPGRRVQELAAELHAELPSGERQLVCRASALRVQAVPADLPPAGAGEAQDASEQQDTREPQDAPQPQDAREPPGGERPLAPPEQATPLRFSLDGSSESRLAATFAATAMEMRWLDDPRALGPARVWMRLRHPLLAGQALTPLARLAATADFGNGVSATLPFDRFLFINADLTVHLARAPAGEWIGLDARTLLSPGGSGLSEAVLHDRQGPLGRAFQTLVVQAR